MVPNLFKDFRTYYYMNKPEEPEIDSRYEELVARSNQFYDAGDYEKALEIYEDASKLAPHYGFAWYMMGMALFKMDKYEEAIGAFDMASSLDVDRPEPHLGKSYVYIRVFDFENAIKALKKVYEVEKSVQTSGLLGLCYALMGDIDEAFKWFVNAIDLNRKSAIKFFEDMYTEFVLMDKNITSDEKVSIKTLIDKIVKKFSPE
jgi:tetratricopeptide (TPR) repeat protein